jgi:hypothetical protein
MDFIVKLPTSHNYDPNWVVCDRLTRYSHSSPARKHTQLLISPGYFSSESFVCTVSQTPSSLTVVPSSYRNSGPNSLHYSK